MSEVDLLMKRKTRRAFVVGGVSAALGLSTWAWLRTRAEEMGLAWPFRRVLDANQALWRRLERRDHLAPVSDQPLRGVDARANGDIGIEDDLVVEGWTLRIIGGRAGADLVLTLAELRQLPTVEITTELKCIEGWSETMSFAGVRFADFMRHHGLAASRYVGLATPDGQYYVSLDMETMLHPQTLLCTAMNGEPLTSEHGAPLRLFTPLKYGIKNLKRVGTIRFADARPPDYWAERGYDWYAGL